MGSDVKPLLKKDKDARHAFRVAQGERQKLDGPVPEKHAVDPLQGMPAAWQAFWGSVPHLDAKDHIKHFKREQKKSSSEKKDAEEDEEQGMSSIEEECAELEAELAQLKENVRAKEKLSTEWEVKLQKRRREQQENDDFGFIYDDLTKIHKEAVMTLSRACSL